MTAIGGGAGITTGGGVPMLIFRLGVPISILTPATEFPSIPRQNNPPKKMDSTHSLKLFFDIFFLLFLSPNRLLLITPLNWSAVNPFVTLVIVNKLPQRTPCCPALLQFKYQPLANLASP
jgi:hypothetical protein